MNHISKSEEETMDIATKLASSLNAGDIVCLHGNLGAGKTVFAKGIALGLGISEHITSPTFTIVNEYTGKLLLYHFDTYRITLNEFIEMGGEEYLYGDGVCLIEWPENIRDILPKKRIEVYLEYMDETIRNIKIITVGMNLPL